MRDGCLKLLCGRGMFNCFRSVLLGVELTTYDWNLSIGSRRFWNDFFFCVRKNLRLTLYHTVLSFSQGFVHSNFALKASARRGFEITFLLTYLISPPFSFYNLQWESALGDISWVKELTLWNVCSWLLRDTNYFLLQIACFGDKNYWTCCGFFGSDETALIAAGATNEGRGVVH